MMVIVPALAVAEQTNEDIVTTGIRGLVISVAPKVGDGIDRPADVPDEDRPNKYAPDEYAKPKLNRLKHVSAEKEFNEASASEEAQP